MARRISTGWWVVDSGKGWREVVDCGIYSGEWCIQQAGWMGWQPWREFKADGYRLIRRIDMEKNQ